MDPEEPQQTVSFMPERTHGSTARGDSSSREFVSFCMGKGKADWGPLTVYGLTKSGDIWAICPFMPSNVYVLFCTPLPILIVHPSLARYHRRTSMLWNILLERNKKEQQRLQCWRRLSLATQHHHSPQSMPIN